MMSQTTFAEWLVDDEFRILIETIRRQPLRESFDGSASYNAAFKNYFQIPGDNINWFSYIKVIANEFVQGQDADMLAADVANEMIMSLEGKSDEFYSYIMQIKEMPPEQQLSNMKSFFNSAARKRALSIAEGGQYKAVRKSKMNRNKVNMSVLSKDDSDYLANVPGQESEPEHDGMGRSVPSSHEEEADRIEQAKSAIIDELEHRKSVATAPRDIKKLELLIRVAQKRWERAHLDDPKQRVVPFGELMSAFQGEINSKGTMHNYLGELDAIAKEVVGVGATVTGTGSKRNKDVA